MFLDQHEEFNKVFLKISMSDNFVGDEDELAKALEEAQYRQMEEKGGESSNGEDSEEFIVVAAAEEQNFSEE